MFHGTKPGWVEVISGVMFAGKSEELIRRVKRSIIARNTVQVFKSHLDDRYGGVFTVSSHDGTLVEAEPVSTSLEIMEKIRPDTHVVAVDEAQFLDAGIVNVANSLANRGVRVILAGTDSDFRGEGFGAMPQLMAAAEIVDKMYAICVVCGGPATRNQRLIGLDPGSRTIGVALSDVGLSLASPYGAIKRGKMRDNAAEIAAIARKEDAGGLVVGLPLSMDGSIGPAAQSASDWALALSE